MRTFRVSKALRQYVNGVLKRKNVPYQYIEKKGELLIQVEGLSGTQFHKIVQRAKCEKKSLETGSLYITKEESENPAAFTELMQVSGRTSFLVL